MIDTAVTLTVYPEEDYFYEVVVSHEELAIFVRGSGANANQTTQQINFGSKDEMRAVAKAINNALSVTP